MQGYIKRNIESVIKSYLKHFPATAVLGPRQCGKSTLVKEINKNFPDFIYLDLQSEVDIAKLKDPYYFFEINKDKTVCLDEIQASPEIFKVLRSVIDSDRRNGRFIILGSASIDLLKQSSETLAGRIAYLELTPFLLSEVVKEGDIIKYWIRGGFPDSYLSYDDEFSMIWRKNFIRTFLERDIFQLGFNIPSVRIGKLWSMIAHINGQILNLSQLSNSLDTSVNTVKHYIEILNQTYLIRLLKPYEASLGKRLVKSPKIYIRDTGVLFALLNIKDMNSLMGHPAFGESWEGLVIENILSELPDWDGYFYRTASGVEIDLILEQGLKKIAIECKASTAPSVSKGFYIAMEDLKIEEAYIIAPVKDEYPIKKNVWVMTLKGFIDKMKQK